MTAFISGVWAGKEYDARNSLQEVFPPLLLLVCEANSLDKVSGTNLWMIINLEFTRFRMTPPRLCATKTTGDAAC